MLTKYFLILNYVSCRYPINSSSFKSDKVPRLMEENEINLENHDKIFSSHWISHNEVVIGSKCNKVRYN